jgi:18S rRNA (guanine1575-N7)-methyltransferase
MTSTSMRRPEESGPADIFYNETEAKKYLHSSRMIEVQTNMAERALEMLNLREGEPSLLLDVGCGTGLSGEVLEESGHSWIGCDVSRDMLGCARIEREVEGDLVHDDMGRGLPFRQGIFDGAISISAVQWLCYSNAESETPRLRLHRFFQSLYRCLRRGARAVLQFYPDDAKQLQMITAAAMRAGFGGGLVIDFPHSTKAKKYFLCLLAGPPDAGYQMPTPMGEDAMSTAGASTAAGWGAAQHSGTAARNEGRQHAKRKIDSRAKGRRGKIAKKSKEWIMIKKDGMRRQGREVANDSKYTGRKRSKVRF